MPLNLRGSEKIQNFNVPVSYRIQDNNGKFLDARNVNSIQGRLDTRFGYSRYNSTALSGPIISLSSFIKTDGTKHTIAKVGTELLKVPSTGSATVIKSGLSATTKHKGITGNDRHIISCESDGLFSWDGTTFTQLGQAAPTTLTATIASGGSLTTAHKYKVAITFVATSIGFESNYHESNEVTASGSDLKISLSSIPATAANAFIDKVYIYIKDTTDNSAYIRADGAEGEITLGTTTATVSAEPTGTSTPPINNDVPGANGGLGGKYLAFFNSSLVYAGNSEFPNDVYFSEEDLPDAFNSLDTGTILAAPGQGPVTGLAVGMFNDAVIDPFLVVFKRKSTRIYSDIGGFKKFVSLSDKIGCVSHDTIQVKNGVVYFLSEEGFRGIVNGRFITNDQGEAITLGNGDIDDIFKSSGHTYEINRNGMANTFSVYYPTLDQYMTWVSEGANNAYSKTYVYEFDVGGFKPWEFGLTATCACIGETSLGRDQVLFGTVDGYIMKHSIQELKTDVDSSNAALPINAYAVLPWMPTNGDYDSTYNFRELILKAIVSSSALTVKTFVDYNLSTTESNDYNFTDPNSGFILDDTAFGVLDEDVMSDDRAIVTARSDINRVGETLAIGFYQNIAGANIGLISMQIDSSKNGNRNLPVVDNDEAVFDSALNTFFPSASTSAIQAKAYADAAAATYAAILALSNFGDPTVDGSWRILKVGSDLQIQNRVSGAWVTAQIIEAL